ncbi:serine/threonine-protein phosphatase [Arthrobacter gandavensis]|uniref:PP2C family protein-serine/threonine phosphatase n=1 Tax=Arthrobacter gandavensis TaxID=169960 RepID=UPI0018902977|nr:protein phosphatase 2C domain-containing protein [Arthrobacter gandavensis]MBF4994597.1 serine/threonine-protein phosphatase [Arthrobacter gandavensis]
MVRFKNDDSAYVGRYLAVVADGMGGHAGGNVASASTVLDLVHLDRPDLEDQAVTVLADEIQAANSLLSELVTTSPELSGMGTTVTAMLLQGDRAALAHIGDSRAYRLKDGVFEQISIDHTFVQRLIDEGRLRPEEAETHPHKNVLMRVLGDVDASPELDLATFEVEPGEKWLLCSDGLNAVLRDSDIEAVLRDSTDLSTAVDTLVELTLAGGSPDNVTVAVIEVVEEADAPAPAREPAPVPSGTAEAPAAASERPAASTDAAQAGTDEASDEEEREADSPVRAEVIRRDLASRPHLLVGAASLATETGQIPIVTKRSAERRAARLLMHKADDDAATPETQTPEPPRKRRRWILIVVLAVIAALLASVLWVGYAWTQTRYYVGTADNRVAIYNGVSQTLGPIKLSQVTETTNIPVDSLPEYWRSRVNDTVPAKDLVHAEQIVDQLRGTAKAILCPQPDQPSPEPSPTVLADALGSSDGPDGLPAIDSCGGQQ